MLASVLARQARGQKHTLTAEPKKQRGPSEARGSTKNRSHGMASLIFGAGDAPLKHLRRESTWRPHLRSDGVSATSVGRTSRPRLESAGAESGLLGSSLIQHRHEVPHGSACPVRASRLPVSLRSPKLQGPSDTRNSKIVPALRKPCTCCTRPATTHLRTLAHFRDALLATGIRIATGQKFVRSDSRKSRFRTQRIVAAPVLYGVMRSQRFRRKGHAIQDILQYPD